MVVKDEINAEMVKYDTMVKIKENMSTEVDERKVFHRMDGG